MWLLPSGTSQPSRAVINLIITSNNGYYEVFIMCVAAIKGLTKHRPCSDGAYILLENLVIK